VTAETKLLDALGEALVAVDLDLRVVEWSRGAEQLFGWSAEEVCGQFVPRLVASSLVYEAAFLVVRTVRAGQVWRGALRLRHKSGIEVVCQSTVSGLYDEQGGCTGYVSLHRLQLAEDSAALQKSGVLFKSSNDIVIVLDETNRIVAWNPAAERALKWNATETLFHPYEEFVHGVSNIAVVIEALRQHKSWRGELVVCDRSGEELTFDTDATLVTDQSGRYLGVITVSRDITSSRRHETARRRSEARLRALLAIIPDTFLRVGRDGGIHDWVVNGSFRVLFGGEPTSGRHLSQLFPEVAGRLLAAMEAAAHERRMQHLTYHTTVAGKPSDLIFRVIGDASEEALIIVQDVTELYQMERELSESEERFRQLVEQKQVGVYLLQEGRFAYVNPRFAEICGYDRDELLAVASANDIVHPADLPMVAENQRLRLAGQTVPAYRFRFVRKEGAVIDVEVYGARIVFHGRAAILGTVLDITERKQAEDALRDSEERYRTFVDSLHEGAMLLDANAVVLACNASACRILGVTEEQLKNPGSYRYGWIFVDEQRRPIALADMPYWLTLRTGQPLTEFVIGQRKPSGALTWLSINTRPLFRPNSALPYGLVASFVDITDRRASEEELQRQAFYDPLTQLPNRALFLDRVERALSQARRTGELVAIGYLDLDQFKLLNDTYGHDVGDLVLKQVATSLRRCLREGDTVARMGGDEFTLLLPNISGPAEAARVAERLLDSLRQPLDLDHRPLHIAASIGLSLFPRDSQQVSELLTLADRALYQAKSAGKNRFHIHAAAADPPTSPEPEP
jgi:diguanylate cyclase (GGDEF)-like protein/PAS domain S-box-containing protein